MLKSISWFSARSNRNKVNLQLLLKSDIQRLEKGPADRRPFCFWMSGMLRRSKIFIATGVQNGAKLRRSGILAGTARGPRGFYVFETGPRYRRRTDVAPTELRTIYNYRSVNILLLRSVL